MSNAESHAPLLAIVGPTASGKTDVALEIAERLQGEIINCDSIQVYRKFEIGSAKPTQEERARVAHHLLDVVDWNEPFDAHSFVTLARKSIDDIRERGKLPILCGGTGMYLRVLRWGLMDAPSADPELRARLLESEEKEPGHLWTCLCAIDPETAKRTDARNLVHVVRALELCELTGERASTLRERHGFKKEELPMCVVVLDRPSGPLRQRIEQRSELMLKRGLLEEVQGLLEEGVSNDCRPMCSVGYKESSAVVRDVDPREGLEARISRSTWAYARRQKTWFRKERDAEHWTVNSTEESVERLALKLKESHSS